MDVFRSSAIENYVSVMSDGFLLRNRRCVVSVEKYRSLSRGCEVSEFETSAHDERKAHAFRNAFYTVFTDGVSRFYLIFYCVVWRRYYCAERQRSAARWRGDKRSEKWLKTRMKRIKLYCFSLSTRSISGELNSAEPHKSRPFKRRFHERYKVGDFYDLKNYARHRPGETPGGSLKSGINYAVPSRYLFIYKTRIDGPERAAHAQFRRNYKSTVSIGRRQFAFDVQTRVGSEWKTVYRCTRPADNGRRVKTIKIQQVSFQKIVWNTTI